MVFSRRSVIVAAASAMAVGCSRSGNSKEAAARSEAPLDSVWTTFRNLYLDPVGRIVDTGNNRISHSEGQGYGLLLAAITGDRHAFEAMWGWTRSTLMRADVALFSWKYDPDQANHVPDPNNATDGDALIAWALMRAGARWGVGEWRETAGRIRQAIRTRLVVERAGKRLLLPGMNGFAQDDVVTLNPSYFVWPALDAFAQADGEGAWGQIIADAENIVRQSRFGPSQLPCDWVDVGADGRVAPSLRYPTRFGFDAVRVGLYALAGRRASLAASIADYWRPGITSGGPIPA
ncbi:MAG TPA: glycosyl hydrolase family 8, partial [Novosphingobium sp.]|nr:glycosyl hydrolase family 8 [Novosphingobium sp.]